MTRTTRRDLFPIILGHDDGATVQVINGLSADAQVIQDPPDSLIDGETVQIAKPKTGASPAGNGGSEKK